MFDLIVNLFKRKQITPIATSSKKFKGNDTVVPMDSSNTTLEIAKDCRVPAREIPRTPETRSVASSRHNRSQCATTDRGCARVRGGVRGSRST